MTMATETPAGTPAETTLRLDGQTAIITGAAGLIGSALSAGFAANGAHVVMVDRDGDGLARLAADRGMRRYRPQRHR
jgi:NAD(P)-dependent dehydrogenase (short-subunit alcohol dehydrogenase family)